MSDNEFLIWIKIRYEEGIVSAFIEDSISALPTKFKEKLKTFELYSRTDFIDTLYIKKSKNSSFFNIEAYTKDKKRYSLSTKRLETFLYPPGNGSFTSYKKVFINDRFVYSINKIEPEEYKSLYRGIQTLLTYIKNHELFEENIYNVLGDSYDY